MDENFYPNHARTEDTEATKDVWICLVIMVFNQTDKYNILRKFYKKYKIIFLLYIGPWKFAKSSKILLKF